MTCIAWDGKTLAGDKQSNDCGMPVRVTKIRRIGRLLVGGTGDAHLIREMHEWIAAGRKRDDLPAAARSKADCATLIVIDAGAILLYQHSHVPLLIEQPFYAVGTGRDFAMAAMHLGKTAPEAVAVACVLDANCGIGIDTLELEQP